MTISYYIHITLTSIHSYYFNTKRNYTNFKNIFRSYTFIFTTLTPKLISWPLFIHILFIFIHIHHIVHVAVAVWVIQSVGPEGLLAHTIRC